jgi:hypothetical protein
MTSVPEAFLWKYAFPAFIDVRIFPPALLKSPLKIKDNLPCSNSLGRTLVSPRIWVKQDPWPLFLQLGYSQILLSLQIRIGLHFSSKLISGRMSLLEEEDDFGREEGLSLGKHGGVLMARLCLRRALGWSSEK